MKFLPRELVYVLSILNTLRAEITFWNVWRKMIRKRRKPKRKVPGFSWSATLPHSEMRRGTKCKGLWVHLGSVWSSRPSLLWGLSGVGEGTQDSSTPSTPVSTRMWQADKKGRQKYKTQDCRDHAASEQLKLPDQVEPQSGRRWHPVPVQPPVLAFLWAATCSSQPPREHEGTVGRGTGPGGPNPCLPGGTDRPGAGNGGVSGFPGVGEVRGRWDGGCTAVSAGGPPQGAGLQLLT